MLNLPAFSWKSAVNRAVFGQALEGIHAGIASGAYYQIDYTHQLHGRAAQAVDGAALFAALQ